jgi:RNA polymerase sigma-70 factor, ECF subfamily
MKRNVEQKMALNESEISRHFENSTIGYADLLFRIAYARLGNAQDAEDVVQETYMKAFRSFGDFREGTNIKAWLTQILVNSIRDRYRKHSHMVSTVELDEAMGDGADEPAFPGPEELLCNDETDPELSRALKSMSEKLAIPLVLREAYDASYEEIANVLNVPKGTVMSRLSRARLELRRLLLAQSKVLENLGQIRGSRDAL